MANPEHVEILNKGVEAWTAWREADRAIRPNLSGANLSGADLFGTNLFGANVTHTVIFATSFGFNDLSDVEGLKTCLHHGPSALDIHTLVKSKNLPEAFLKGCGLSDTVIANLGYILERPTLEFYSCFISYSSKDEEFANRLHADLQASGVRCWFAPEDLKIGERFHLATGEAVRLRGKLVLILSEHSVESRWVKQEVDDALEEEALRDTTVLFPLDIDGAVAALEGGWAGRIRATRRIGDFTKWKEHDVYQAAFRRLMRDLQVEEKE